MGLPPNHPNSNRISGFPLINHLFWGIPMTMEPPHIVFWFSHRLAIVHQAQELDRCRQSWTKQWRGRRSKGHANKGTYGAPSGPRISRSRAKKRLGNRYPLVLWHFANWKIIVMFIKVFQSDNRHKLNITKSSVNGLISIARLNNQRVS